MASSPRSGPFLKCAPLPGLDQDWSAIGATQCRLDKEGATKLVCDLITSTKNEKIFQESIGLAIRLLDGGNTEIQVRAAGLRASWGHFLLGRGGAWLQASVSPVCCSAFGARLRPSSSRSLANALTCSSPHHLISQHGAPPVRLATF